MPQELFLRFFRELAQSQSPILTFCSPTPSVRVQEMLERCEKLRQFVIHAINESVQAMHQKNDSHAEGCR